MKHRRRISALACVIALSVSCSGGDDAAEPNGAAEVSNSGITTDATDGNATEPDATELPVEPADEPTNEPTAAPVCELATDEEISAIVDNPVAGIDINATLCEYSLLTGAPAVDGTAVDVFANDAFDQECSLEFDVAGTSDAVAMEGVGSIALWKAGSSTPQLLICTGTTFLTITQYKPSSVTDEEAMARAKQIADVVLGRQ